MSRSKYTAVGIRRANCPKVRLKKEDRYNPHSYGVSMSTREHNPLTHGHIGSFVPT